MRGATPRQNDGRTADAISIHAPLAGCDLASDEPAQLWTDFNPRTPCGVRLYFDEFQYDNRNFNPRTPCGVRLSFMDYIPRKDGISIHAPLAGCDQVVIIYIKICVHFNPRTPCGVRLVTSHDVFDVAAISIHAPLAGCDAQHDGRDDAHDHFNPRTPCGVRP